MNRKPEVGRHPDGRGNVNPPRNPWMGGTIKPLMGWRVAVLSSGLLAVSLLMGIISLLAGFLLLLPLAVLILPFFLRWKWVRKRNLRAARSHFPWKGFVGSIVNRGS